MRQSFRTYLGSFSGCLLAGLVLVISLNLVADPFGAYPFFALECLRPYREQVASRPAKAELAARGGFDTLVIGSSRVRAGISVEDPAFRGARVCNLGLGGTTFTETSKVLEMALSHNRARRVLLGADFHLFSDARSIDPTFEVSRFNPQLNRLEYHFRNVFGSDATDESWSMVRKCWRHEPTSPAKLGFVAKSIPVNASQRTLFARQARASLTSPGAEGHFQRSPHRLELFRQMIRRCQDENIELIVFVPPVHALQLEIIRIAGKWPDLEQWKRDLVQIIAEERATASVPFWDFTGFTGPLAEAVPSENDRKTRMMWFWEMSHFTPELGAWVLGRALASESPLQEPHNDFGTRLTPANLENHLARLRTAREAYIAAHSEELTWIVGIAARVKGQAVSEAGEF